MKIITGIEQGTEEWHELRRGKVTASNFSKVLAKGRGGAESKTKRSYMLQLAAEHLTGAPQETYTNAAMEWGSECEPAARAAYVIESGNPVEEVTFIERSEFVGVSPDGLVLGDGLLEIKSPNTTTQIDRVLCGEFPTEYKPQVQGQLWVSERDWCDFVSFDPRINGPAEYFKVRVHRDDEYIKKLAEAVDVFVDELQTIIHKLSTGY